MSRNQMVVKTILIPKSKLVSCRTLLNLHFDDPGPGQKNTITPNPPNAPAKYNLEPRREWSWHRNSATGGFQKVPCVEWTSCSWNRNWYPRISKNAGDFWNYLPPINWWFSNRKDHPRFSFLCFEGFPASINGLWLPSHIKFWWLPSHLSLIVVLWLPSHIFTVLVTSQPPFISCCFVTSQPHIYSFGDFPATFSLVVILWLPSRLSFFGFPFPPKKVIAHGQHG